MPTDVESQFWLETDKLRLNIQNRDDKKVEAICSPITACGEWTKSLSRVVLYLVKHLGCLSICVGVQGGRETSVCMCGGMNLIFRMCAE